ncbi:hypothetical protein [Bdellovibrio bacteriovorus]|uniref:hypothetical protein n=1 Tax=Bdellovibrio bacteriovorus TaxID=959 RepID=UPI003AA8726A
MRYIICLLLVLFVGCAKESKKGGTLIPDSNTDLLEITSYNLNISAEDEDVGANFLNCQSPLGDINVSLASTVTDGRVTFTASIPVKSDFYLNCQGNSDSFQIWERAPGKVVVRSLNGVYTIFVAPDFYAPNTFAPVYTPQ